MKKLMLFFCSLILIALMFGALFLSGAIYETSNKATVETYFFQPDDSFLRRQATPKALTDISDDELRDMLLSKYITEYFYVTPDVEDVNRRTAGKSPLARMSVVKVFESWLENVAPKIEEMAQKNMLRTAKLISVTPQAGSDKYWRVEYELKTWERPNDLAISPIVTRGEMYMQIVFKPGIRQEFREHNKVAEYLENGGDPAALFMFGITDLTTQDDE